MPVCASSGVYVPRDTHHCDAAVLIREHLAGFLERVEEGSHAPLPGFVQGELRGFAVCGDFSQVLEMLVEAEALTAANGMEPPGYEDVGICGIPQ